MKAFVLDMNGNPLFPTRCGYAKKLIQKGRAFCKYRFPFTIQLKYPTSERTVKTTLGIDPGFSLIGFSLITDKKELICGVLEQEKLKTSNPTSDRLKDKAMYRRMRRSRLRHRQSRWLNRANSKKEGWLPPSINRKKQTHVNLINKLRKYVPIDRIVLEKNKFDIAKLDNPDIEGTDYQQGKLFESNRKVYLAHEQNGFCPICKKRLSEETTHIHHIKPRRVGGSNTIDNLVLLHDSCHVTLDHSKWYDYEKLFKQQGFKSKHKADTCMNMICKKLVEELNPEVSYGYITQVNRINRHLSKAHYNDAFVIAGGDKQERCEPLLITQKHKNDRCLQKNQIKCKGGRRVRRQRYKYQKGDLICLLNKQWYICGGMLGSGRYVYNGLRKENGNPDYVKVDDVVKHISKNGLIFTLFGENKNSIK